MDLDSTFFSTLNGLSLQVNDTVFYSKLNRLKTSLESGEPISTTKNPTPDDLIEKLKKVNDETEDLMKELRSAGASIMDIYEEVTKKKIGVAVGRDNGRNKAIYIN